MKIITNKDYLIKLISDKKNIGFVPTMGGIHLGHTSLIKKSISDCSITIVSIFINKPQFNKKNDYIKYPRILKKDIFVLRKLKIDYLFLPSSKQIYPKGVNKNIKINSFKKKLCGKYRPGHFEAVVDVIEKFINIIKPKKIYMGKKDMQQLMIIKNFVKNNYKNTKIIGCKTIREKNGIPYSSRNFLLAKKEKIIASKIVKLLLLNKKKIVTGINSINLIKKIIYKFGVRKIDYIKILDVNRLIKPYKKNKNYKIFISYYLKTTRLIDNI